MITNTRRVFPLIFFTLLLVSVVSNSAKACHLAAADIFIEYAGKGVDVCDPQPDYTYKVTMVIYSSCNCGLVTGATETVSYQSVVGGTGVLSLTMSSDGIDTIDQLCPYYSSINKCRVLANDNLPAYKRRTYTATVTLPSAQPDWKFWWSSSARNPSVNVNSTGTRLYIECGMNLLKKFNNNTPRFESNPLPYICVGQTYNYLNSPFDPDKWDVGNVVVESTVPLTAAGSPLSYFPNYSPQFPIPNYKLDKRSGTATFLPQVTGQYTISFRASDPASYVLRDVQIAVLPCTAPAPLLDQVAQNVTNASLIGVPRENDSTTIDSVVFVCPGSALSLTLNGRSKNDTNKVYMRADLSRFSGANFSVAGQGTNRVTGEFDWTPTANDYGQYILRVTTVDSSCRPDQPVVLVSKAEIKINVVPGLDAGPDHLICELNPQPVKLFVKGTENLRIKWSVVGGGPVVGFKKLNINNPVIEYPFVNGQDTIFYPKTTAYIVSTVDLTGTCKSRDTVVVALDTTNTVRITPKNPNNEDDALVVCRPDYLQLEAHIKGEPPVDNQPCGLAFGASCVNPVTLQFGGSPIYGAIDFDTLSEVSPVMYTNVYSAKKQYLFRKGELSEMGLHASALSGMAFEMTGFKGSDHDYNLMISFRCTEKDELSADEGFVNFGFTTVYDETVKLNDGWHHFKFKTPYNWDTTKNLLVQICYNYSQPIPCNPGGPVPIIRFAPTTYTAGLSYKPLDVQMRDVCGAGKVPGILMAKARPVLKFDYCDVNTLPFDIKWKEGSFLSDSTIPQPLAYLPASDRYVVQLVGRSTCLMRDTLDVYVPDHDMYVQPEDTAICLGDKAPYIITGGKYFKWYEYTNGEFVEPTSISNPHKANGILSPERSTEYRIVVSDSVWCYDTLAAKVKILPLPDVRIKNHNDTVVRFGQPFQLLVSGARLYNWSPVSPLNNPNISYPIARPTEDTRFIVGGIGTNGCRAFDTLSVIVNKRDNVFIPSAFSPNGDGKNDVFRVTNLTFQRIMEFRVFNRQGLEVFNTTSNDIGWDGTYMGKQQDLGTYSYLIRVGYPDGFVETYKGDVTLVR